MDQLHLTAQRPLEGVRVLELSQIMAGPICGLMLADLGAEVIKIEKISGGDDARAFNNSGTPNEMPASFQMINRGKKSVAIDIRTEEGRMLLLRLVKDADILTENFRPGTLQRLGLGPDVLRKENPRLICVSVSGYGPKGPMADHGGFDLVLQAFSGLISVTGEADRPPVKPGVPIADINAGVMAALGALAAYVHRLRTGEGQWVQTSLLQVSVQQLYWYAALFFSAGKLPERLGTAHPIIAPYQTYRCADGDLAIGGGNDTNWRKICKVLERPEWENDVRFATPKSRLENRAALESALNSVLAMRTRAAWEHAFIVAGVPVGPVQTVDEALNHAQTRAVGMVIDVDNANGGIAQAIGLPLHFNGENKPARTAAPFLGEHTRELLSTIGVGPEDYTSLCSAGVCLGYEGSSALPDQASGGAEAFTVQIA
ncbi:CoA transferase [Cupriavidus sp. TA19]|nr:CoA transferase [Cupriavidus sp. TA19]